MPLGVSIVCPTFTSLYGHGQLLALSHCIEHASPVLPQGRGPLLSHLLANSQVLNRVISVTDMIPANERGAGGGSQG